MMRQFYRVMTATSADRLWWRLGPPSLRILAYHGVCDDSLAGEPWMPGYFVTASVFDRQLRFLRQEANVIPLAEAARALAAGKLPERAVALTFDDGYANNLELAAPMLARYGMPATVFLSSHYIESGALYPFLKIHLLRMPGAAGYKNEPLDTVLSRVDQAWQSAAGTLTEAQGRTLRPLTIGEVRAAQAGGLLEFGAHAHSHCILRNESPARREQEIRLSLQRVAEWTGRPATLFSYPNGEAGDFNDADQRVLRDGGVEAAVTGIAGINRPGTPPLSLLRFPVGLYHDDAGFRAEVCGLRAQVLSMGRRLRG